MTNDPHTALWLHAPKELRDAVIIGQGLPAEIAGQPVKHFWGDSIQCGDYVHPNTGVAFNVNTKRIDGWVDGFRKMKAAGVEVPIVEDHQERAAKALGFVVDAKREGNRLLLLHQFIGDDAIRMAARNRISLKISPNFKDGRGAVYSDVFTHSALTPVPVVPSQAGFVAASRDQATDQGLAMVLTLAAPDTGGNKMPTFSKLRERLGAATDVSDDALEVLTLSRLDAAKVEATAAIKRADDAEAKAVELSRNAPPPPPDPLMLSREAGMMVREIDLSVREGDLPPVIANALKTSIVDKDANYQATLLSRTDAIPGKLSPVEWVVSLFKEKKLGTTLDGKEKTPPQTTELSRSTPTGNDDNANSQAAQDAVLAQSTMGRAILADRKRKAS